MRPAHKLRLTAVARGQVSVEGRYGEGHVLAVEQDGKARFCDEAGETCPVRIPRSVDARWLAAAAELAPVPAVVLFLEHGGTPILAHVFATPDHFPLDERFRIEAKQIDLVASESIEIRTGKSIVTVGADGDIQVRGKNITSRASNVNRIRGGAVRIN
jgi:hypothetical protein